MHWRQHPQLAGKFLPDHPDDLQVVVHDGGPRLTQARPELVWVTVTADEGDVFVGRVLNQPTQLRTVAQGDPIRFMVPEGSPHPILVTEKYLRERPQWNIQGCNGCGCDELFDAPSDLMRALFPELPPEASMQAFTSFCPLCGGVQMIESLDAAATTSTTFADWRAALTPWVITKALLASAVGATPGILYLSFGQPWQLSLLIMVLGISICLAFVIGKVSPGNVAKLTAGTLIAYNAPRSLRGEIIKAFDNEPKKPAS